MGFYGNITNTNKTQFTFDRTYPNRYDMEKRLAVDEIYLGRYVLIEYGVGEEATLDSYIKAYSKTVGNEEQFFTSPNFEASTRIKWGEKSDIKNNTVTTKDIIYVEKDITPNDNNNTKSLVFYICNNNANVTNQGAIASFKLVTSTDKVDYTTNYNIDLEVYGPGRGYDSTVWQKVYTQGNEKYVQIAELNSVVPTFDLAADAPTMEPITPHFDADSTNVYYKLHWQPAWGFRVAKAAGTNSDENVTWQHSSYNPSTDKTTTTTETVAGAINFNEPAFQPQVGQATINKLDNSDNYITVLPTGQSGQNYNTHDGTGELKPANDIQEMRINLPAIGNMMSKAWDIIHGPNRDNARTDANGSLQGRLDSFTEMAADEIPVKRGFDGTIIGATINGGKTTSSDYTGKDDDAWIETQVNGNDETITIHHTFTPKSDTTTSANKNNSDGNGINQGNGNSLKLYTPIVDARGHVVGKNTETVTLPYGFKTISTNGKGNNTDINETTSLTTENVIAETTQDTLALNSGNKWIRIETSGETDTVTFSHDIHSIDTTNATSTDLNLNKVDTIIIQDIDQDNAGHITKNKKHTYTLPYGFKTITPGSNSTATTNMDTNTTSIVADSTQDTLTVAAGNKWVHVAGDESADTLKIAHEVHSIDETPKDATYLDTTGNGAFIIQDLSFDKAGHVLTNQSHTYHLPHAIRNITVGVSSSTTEGSDAAGTVSADTYNDTLTLNAQNRWVNLKADTTNDIISIGHANAGTTSQSANLENNNNTTPNFGDNIKVFTAGVDQMGHVKELSSYNIKLPTPSLNDLTATTSSVITGLSMNDTTGAITQTNNNVGNLALTDYATVKINDTTYVQATDSINNAFSKVDTRIDTENTRATNAEKALNDRIDALDFSNTPESSQVVYQVTQTDGKINTAHKDVGTLTLKGYEIPESVSTLDLQASNTLNTALGKLEYRLNAEKSRAESAENDLNLRIDNIDYTDTASTTQIITKIDQTDGKIAVTRGAAGGLVLTNYSKATTASPIMASDSINGAFGKLEYKLDTEITRATSAEDAINTNLTLEVNRAKKAEEDINARIDGILGGVTVDELNTFKELSDALNDDTNFATTVNNAIAGVQTNLNTEIENRGIAEAAINKSIEDLSAQIGKNVEDESAVNKAITDRLDVLEKADYVNITAADITKWNAAETNVQSDWNETNTNADGFIKNKPTDLVRTADIVNMAVKSDLDQMVIKSEIAEMAKQSDLVDMVKTTTTFVYEPATNDAEGNPLTEEIRFTIEELMAKVKQLESRIAELENEVVPTPEPAE